MTLLASIITRDVTGNRPTAGTAGRLFYDTTLNKFQRDNGSTWDDCPGAAGGAAGLYAAHLCYQEQQTSGTDGGTFTSGAWQTRVLNTEVADTGNHGVLASNQVTLDAGTYRVLASAPASEVSSHQLRLQDITDSSTLVLGKSAWAAAATATTTEALLVGRFTIAGAKVIELQHRCFATKTGSGLGVSCGFGVSEIYSTLELFKES